jgi:hypothetical protein
MNSGQAATLKQQDSALSCRHRARRIVALYLVAPAQSEQVQLFLRFYTLANNRHPQPVRQADDGYDDRGVSGLRHHRAADQRESVPMSRAIWGNPVRIAIPETPAFDA